MFTSVNPPLHNKVQKFSSGTGSPVWSRKKGRKMVVCVCACVCNCLGRQDGLLTFSIIYNHYCPSSYDFTAVLRYTQQTDNHLTVFSQDNLGKPVPIWILMKQEIMGWQWHQLDNMQIICTSLQIHNHAGTSSLNLYWPDALPDDNQRCQSTEGN